MESESDIIVSLLEKPFGRRSAEKKKIILKKGRPKPDLSSIQIKKHHNRTFKSTWYNRQQWMCGSINKQRIFCWPCILLGVKKNTWNEEGYNDWKNLPRSIDRHRSSIEHIQNAINEKYLSKDNNLSIAEKLDEGARISKIKHNENVKKNRQVLEIIIETITVLCKQNLPLRGHDESDSSLNQGNYREFLNSMMKCNKEAKLHWENMGAFSGVSKTIQNELLNCIKQEIEDEIHDDLKNAEFFSIQVDETTDTSETAQCSIICRFIDNIGEIREHFLGFYDVGEDKTADGLCQLLVRVLEPFDFKKKLVAQTFDGASVMASDLNGLQAKIRAFASQALFTHCLAHRLNLVLQYSHKKIKSVNVFFSTLQSIPAFFHKSPKRTSVLDRIVGKRIPTHSEVRWNSNAKIIQVVYSERKNLIQAFEELTNLGIGNTVHEAEGFRKILNSFNFVFYLLIFKDIFLKTEHLYSILQKKTVDIQMCIDSVKQCQTFIEDMRDEEKLEDYMDEAETETECSPPDSTDFKRIYYEIIDNIVNQISIRFSSLQSLKFLELADKTCLAKYHKDFPKDALAPLMNTYGQYFDKAFLRNELEVIYAEKNENLFQQPNIQAVLKKIIEKDLVEVIPQSYKLFCLIAITPVTSSSVERSFSCLSRIKTALRNTMTQERLTSLAMISIEKEKLSKLMEEDNWYDNIINRYANSKNRKLDLLYM